MATMMFSGHVAPQTNDPAAGKYRALKDSPSVLTLTERGQGTIWESPLPCEDVGSATEPVENWIPFWKPH